jgi:hypothetical protein
MRRSGKENMGAVLSRLSIICLRVDDVVNFYALNYVVKLMHETYV